MRIALILFLFLAPQSYASSSVEVTAVVDGKIKNIGIESSVYGDITGLLSTCSRYGKFITDPEDLDESYIDYDVEATLNKLEKVKAKDHIKILFSNVAMRLPIRNASVSVEEIYVGFSKVGYPIIFTHGDGFTYSYAKCSGYLLIEHFQCNTEINKMFKIEPQHVSCENH